MVIALISAPVAGIVSHLIAGYQSRDARSRAISAQQIRRICVRAELDPIQHYGRLIEGFQ